MKVISTLDRRWANDDWDPLHSCFRVEHQALKGYHGVVAQLGERLNGIQEVRGSSPLGSISDLFLASIL